MKKLISIFAIPLLLPSFAVAAWWGNFSWITPLATTTPILTMEASSTPVRTIETIVEKPVARVVYKDNPTLALQLETALFEKQQLEDKYNKALEQLSMCTVKAKSSVRCDDYHDDYQTLLSDKTKKESQFQEAKTRIRQSAGKRSPTPGVVENQIRLLTEDHKEKMELLQYQIDESKAKIDRYCKSS